MCHELRKLMASADYAGPLGGEGKIVEADEAYFGKADGKRTLHLKVFVKGKKPSDMKNKEDFWEVTEVVPGEGLMQKPDAFGCKLGDYT